MTEKKIVFDDAAGYEQLMGVWSRLVGQKFLAWVQPPVGSSWLDIGCGTGVFSELILSTMSPSSLTAVDPSPDQLAFARKQPFAQRIQFQQADATALPFANNSFDVVVSALVINFIGDRPKAAAEMRRVCRSGGIVAGYVWNFAAMRGPSPIQRTLRKLGHDIPPWPGAADTTLEALTGLFASAGLVDVESVAYEVVRTFKSFEEFWAIQTPAYLPTSKVVAGLGPEQKSQFYEAVRELLVHHDDGAVSYSAVAHAVKARVP